MQRLDTNNQIVKYLLTIGLIFTLGLATFSCAQKAKQGNGDGSSQETVISETVPSNVFQQKIKGTKDVIILDVRTPEELTDGYIEGAINIDFNGPDFQSKIKALNKDATYMVYCASGIRSRKAANLMKEMEFRSVYDLAGGFKGWSAKGLPSVKP
ncbi:MAG: rhodanese-like domain-containing protein [Cyclobacteriaceae bacterium]|nr:rhodanese-like domain-containing protein [Cyclobacteriaceae bacterium]